MHSLPQTKQLFELKLHLPKLNFFTFSFNLITWLHFNKNFLSNTSSVETFKRPFYWREYLLYNDNSRLSYHSNGRQWQRWNVDLFLFSSCRAQLPSHPGKYNSRLTCNNYSLRPLVSRVKTRAGVWKYKLLKYYIINYCPAESETPWACYTRISVEIQIKLYLLLFLNWNCKTLKSLNIYYNQKKRKKCF